MENGQAEFDKLLRRYLDGTSSKAERKQLYELIVHGDFDEKIEQDVLNSLENEAYRPDSASETVRMNKLYEGKIKNEISQATAPPEKNEPGSRTFFRFWAIAASVTGLAVATGLWYTSLGPMQDTPRPSVQMELQASVPQASITRFLDKQLVHLPDGSTVLLNDGAELTYDNESFGKVTREVNLQGEAFFDIRPDPARVFVVKSGEVKTTVLGTAFNIKSLPGHSEVQVTVARGKVSVGTESGTYDLLLPDQQLTINTSNNTYLKKDLKSSVATEWQKDFLIFDDIAVGVAAEKLYQKFGVKVGFKNEKLKDCPVTASFLYNENLDHILEVISTIHDFRYSYVSDGSEVMIDGDGTCN